MVYYPRKGGTMRKNKRYVVISEQSADVVHMPPRMARKLAQHARNPIVVIAGFRH
jgi:hypothetical protein